MSILKIETVLEAMTIGMTRVVNDHVVTRRSVNSFEVDRIDGREHFDIFKAAERIAN